MFMDLVTSDLFLGSGDIVIMAWILMLILFFIFGAVCAKYLRKEKGRLCCMLLPPLVVLSVLVVQAYFLPYSRGELSTWSLTFVVVGLLSVIASLAGFFWVSKRGVEKTSS